MPATKPKTDEREVRALAIGLELREATAGETGRTAHGYAALFNSETDVGGYWKETIAPGAFSKSLREHDVLAVHSHNTGRVVGRLKAGTLTLREDILMSGVNAQVYNIIEQVKKSNGFLGIGGGTKTSYETVTGSIGSDISGQFKLIVADIANSVIAFGKQIGVDVAGAINQVPIQAANLSFKDMSGDEIEKALQAYFSSVADQIAGLINGPLPIASLQKAGEGLYETLARVVKTMTSVDTALSSINMTGLVSFNGGSAVGAAYGAVDLTDQFGGIDAFQQAVSSFADKFLSEAERMQPIMAAVTAEMTRLGYAGVTTNEHFKNLVQSQDLATESGRAMFAQLLAVAPAFAKTTEYLASLNGEAVETGKTAQQLAEIAKNRRALEIQIMDLEGRAQEAIAAKRADELAAIDESLRPLQQRVYQLLDEKSAAEAAAQAQQKLAAEQQAAAEAAEQLARTRRGMEAQVLELQGNAAGALAIQRQLELEAMDASLRPLQELIYQLTDAKTAADAAAQAQEQLAAEQQAAAEAAAEAAAQLARTRRGMEAQVLELQGNAAGALAIQRHLELEAMDASLRPLQELIYQLTDAKTAADAAAQAQEELAGEQREAAEAAAQLARQRRDLEIQLLEATGHAAEALAARRADELTAIDETLRGLQQQVWAAQDAKAAAEEAARAQAEAARAAQQAAEEAARRAEELARKRMDLENQIYILQGRGAEAVARQRQVELAQLDESLRALQQQVWVLQDAKAAEEERTKAIADARDALSQAYERESGALKDTIEKFSAFGKELREFAGTLYQGTTGLGDAYRVAQALFVDTASAARLKDADALGALSGVSKEFLDASRARAGTLADYQRDVARVARAVGDAIGASDEVVSTAQAQLNALDALVAGQIDTNEQLLSVVQALAQLNALTASGLPDVPVPAPIPEPPAPTPSGSAPSGGQGSSGGESYLTVSAFRSVMVPMAANVSMLARRIDDWDENGACAVKTRKGDTVATS